MFKIGTVIEGIYDSIFFGIANLNVWFASDTDGVNPFSDNDTSGTYPSFDFAVEFSNNKIYLVGDDSNSNVGGQLPLSTERANFIEHYIGFPVHIETKPNFGDGLDNGASIKFVAWLGNFVSNRDKVLLTDYNGNALTYTGENDLLPANHNWIIEYVANTSSYPNDNQLTNGINELNPRSSWIITNPQRQDIGNKRQPLLLDRTGNLGTELHGAIPTNNPSPTFSGTINRLQKFNLIIDSSETTSNNLEFDNNNVISRDKHTITGRITDRFKAGFDNTPILFGGNDIPGLFEIPTASNRLYNMVEFRDTATNEVVVVFESV